MNPFAKRLLGDAFIVTSWTLYVAVFLVLWAPLLPEWLVCCVVLFALLAGYCVGSAWKRKVTGHAPLASKWLPEMA